MIYFIIAGIVFMGLGAGLFYGRNRSLGKALDIKYYETSKVKELVETYQSIRQELGVGNYSGTIVELSGVGHSDSPLIAEFSRRPSLYYETSVVREYEVTEQQRDKDGNYRTVTSRRSETVSNNSQYIPFYLDDNSGAKILVDMKGAKKDLVQSHNRFSPEPPQGFSLNFGSGGSKTIGYRYQEKIIPADVRLYVLGELSDRSGELSVVKPSEKDKYFIVSTKSEEEIVKSAESAALWQKIGAIVSILVGVGLVVAAFFQ